MTTGTDPLAGRNFQDENGNPIVPGEQLGAGGGGTVCDVDGQPDAVVKIWHDDAIPEDAEVKIRHMVNNPVIPELGSHWRITWPQHMVTENGNIVGYVMPKLDYTLPWESIIGYYNQSAARGTGANQGREIRIENRVRIASNLALGFKAVHDAGYVIGDINQSNAEANRLDDVALMDCDSYGFTDPATGRVFSDNYSQDGYQAPEFQDGFIRGPEQDRFGLAVLIFFLLTGSHPYLVTGQHADDYETYSERIKAWLFPPASGGSVSAPGYYNEAWDRLTDKQQELFLRCFDKKHEGEPRPTPEEWWEALQELPAAPPDPAPPQPSPQPQPSQPQPQPSQPQPQPQPRPQPQPQPRPQPRPRPRPLPLPTRVDEELGYDVFRWVSALIAYGALIPLLIFSDFRPWLWLSLMLVSALFFYFPVRRLFETPITRTRWIIIGVAAFPSAWFLLGLIVAALSTWPWWLWLGTTPVVAFVFLVPARGAFGRSNVRRRWAMIGAATLVALFILAGIGMAGFREFQEWRWQRSLNAVSASNDAAPSAPGNLINAGSAAGGSVVAVAPTDTPVPAPAVTPAAPAAVAPVVQTTQVCGQPANFRYSNFNPDGRALVYQWDPPAGSDLTVTGYLTESREKNADGTYTEWTRRDILSAATTAIPVGPYGDEIDGRTFENRVYALCDSEYSEPSDSVAFTYPVAVAAAPAATPTPVPTAAPTPTVPVPTATPPPTATPLPAPTVAPTPAATRTPAEWLIQSPAHPKITDAKSGTQVLLQGCYLGNRDTARRFRLASWDVWEPGRYGSQLKFVKIVTNNGAYLTLQQGACYEARVVKHVNSSEEYVCLDPDAIHPQQSPCDTYLENAVIPTFILYPNSPDDPQNFTDSFIRIRKPAQR